MSDPVRAIDCPSCGAPLQMPAEHQRFFTCTFCGTTLEDQTTLKDRETGHYPKVIIHSTTTIPTPSPKIYTKRLGWIILGVIIVSVALAVIIPLLASGVITFGGAVIADQLGGLTIYSFGLTHKLPSDNDSQADVISVSRNSDDTNRMVYVDFEADPPLRWQSEPLGEGADYSGNHVTANEATIFLVYETTLTALNRNDGSISWQVTLSDEVSHICEDCAQLFEDWLVLLTTDGVLNGINAQSGDHVWSVRLSATPRQLMNLAGNAGVLDEDEEIGISVYEAANGALIQRVVPDCENPTFSGHPYRMGIYDPVFVSGDGNQLYTPIGSHRGGCFMAWDSTAMTIKWNASVPGDVLDALNWDPYMFSEDALFISAGHKLFAVSTIDGSYFEVFHDEDHNLIPLAVNGNILLTLAERTRGTRKYSLWGIDTDTQANRWEYKPQSEDMHSGGIDSVGSRGLWYGEVRDDKVVIIDAEADPGTVTFTVLNLVDGSQFTQTRYSLDEKDSSYWMQVVGWSGDTVYLVLGTKLLMIDYLTGTEVGSWP
jgi:hypothetical protein